MAYLFLEIEAAHRTAIYCGVVKLHRVDATLAGSAVDRWRMKREEFSQLFETVFGQKVPDTAMTALKEAEAVRDKIIHDSFVNDKQHRAGQVRVFDYADELHAFLPSVGAVSPFEELRGFKGAAQPLGQTSRWVLKGLGFPV